MVVKFDKRYTDRFKENLIDVKTEEFAKYSYKAGQFAIIHTLDSSDYQLQHNYNLNIDNADLLYHPFELMIHAAQGKFFKSPVNIPYSQQSLNNLPDEKVAAAIYLGNNEYIELLHQYKLYDFSDSDSFYTTKGWSPIDTAAESNNYKMVKALLDAGAKPDQYNQKTLDITTSQDIANLLLEHGARPTIKESGFLDHVLRPKVYNFYNEFQPKFNFHNHREDCLEKDQQIPHKIHYIWLTNEADPREAPTSHLEITKNTVETFRNQTEYTDWEFVYHTNSIVGSFNTTNFFRDLGFKIVNIQSEYSQFATGSSLVDLFIDANKWGMAADIARYEIINSQGGIYYDLNFNGTRALDHEVCAYDYFNFVNDIIDNNFFYPIENYFIASAPNHPILQQIIEDYKVSFFANSDIRQYFTDSFNSTLRDETDDLYILFPINTHYHLTENSIIFKFKEFIRSYDVEICGKGDAIMIQELGLSEELLEKVNSITPIDQCTAYIEPFGSDSHIESASWES